MLFTFRKAIAFLLLSAIFICAWSIPIIYKLECNALFEKFIDEKDNIELNKNAVTILETNQNKQCFKWHREGEEFEYKGRMFDVIRSSKVKQGRIFYCNSDSHEDELNFKLQSIVEHLKNQNAGSPIFKFLKLCLSLFLSNQPSFHFRSIDVFKPTYSSMQLILFSESVTDVLRPPRSI